MANDTRTDVKNLTEMTTGVTTEVQTTKVTTEVSVPTEMQGLRMVKLFSCSIGYLVSAIVSYDCDCAGGSGGGSGGNGGGGISVGGGEEEEEADQEKSQYLRHSYREVSWLIVRHISDVLYISQSVESYSGTSEKGTTINNCPFERLSSSWRLK